MMKLLVAFLAAAFAASLPLQPANGAPAIPAAPSPGPINAVIVFDPPLDTPVRYRWEKTVLKNGATQMSWSVADYRFEQAGEGYRLTVTPVSSGSNESDPEKLAMMQRIEELVRRPFVLRLDGDGVIEELEDADLYWSSIITVLKEALAKEAVKSKKEQLPRMIESVVGMFEKMPPETRLALLTEEVQPVVEFANTETEVGKPITTSIETTSPFGGTINRNVMISLTKVEGEKAHLRLESSIPRAEIDKLLRSFATQLTALPPEKRKEVEGGLVALKRFRHDTASDYEVWVEDGMLDRFHSIETVEVGDKDKQSKKVTSRSMQRVD